MPSPQPPPPQPLPAGLPVLCEETGGIATITLNRPGGLNVLSEEMIAALHGALREFSASPEVRVIILAAAGRAFSAGHDLKSMAGKPEPEMAQLFARCRDMMAAIRHSPQPVIARVQGVAAAAGCQLAATCDLVVASREARFGTTGIRAGLFCSVPMVPLSRVVPPRKALEMLLTGDTIGAEEAERFGLVNRVVAPGELVAATRELAAAIAAHSPYALALGKEGFYRQLGLSYEAAYDIGEKNMVANAVALDGREGMRAFLEKRPPSWEK